MSVLDSAIDPSVFVDNERIDKRDLREQFTVAKNEITTLGNLVSPTDWYGDLTWALIDGLDTAATDNYAVLQNAIDATAEAGGGPVFIPPGTYNFLTAPIVRDRVHLIGSGWETTVLRATGSQIAVLETDAIDDRATYCIENLGLEATSASQLYGLRARGGESGVYRRIMVTGLTATTGAGWDGTQGAWGFFFVPHLNTSAIYRPPINNLMQELYSVSSPNGIKLESTNGAIDGTAGNNNYLARCYVSGFTGTGVEVWGEATTLISIRVNTPNNNVFCFRFMDSVTTVISCDGDSTHGALIATGVDEWGFPLGTHDNSNVGMYFADTSSAVVVNPQGNGCRKRMDFESGVAFNKVQVLRSDYNRLGRVVGGVPRYVNTERTTDSTLEMIDAGDVVRTNIVGTANTITVPLHDTVPFPLGTEIDVIQYGTGVTTIVAAVGVTIQKPSTLTISTRFGRMRLFKMANNIWIASGDLA